MRETFRKTLQQLATSNKRIVAVGCDLTFSSMSDFRAAFPDRFFMEGISEQYVTGMAAGLAGGGLIPYVETVAAFGTRRAFEQLFVDIGLQRLPVRLVGTGGGLSCTEFGPTHTALEDLALLRQVPNMAICVPRSNHELRHLLSSTIYWDGPIYIRLGKVTAEGDDGPLEEFGNACRLRAGQDALIVSTGLESSAIIEIVEMLTDGGLDPEVLHFATLTPFDSEALCEAAKRVGYVVIVEEHNRNGGLGSLVIETLADARILRPTTRLGTDFEPRLNYGTYYEATVNFGLRGPNLAKAILAACT
ncbi:transketolase [Bradyrhizobium sp. USDA 4341]